MEKEQQFRNISEQISAIVFYKNGLSNHRRLINDLIKETMERGEAIVKLPFAIYPDVIDEIIDLGWEEKEHEDEHYPNCDVSWIYPKTFVDADASLAIQKQDTGLITAEEFYKKTLEKQWLAVNKKTTEAFINGEPEVKLPYQVYPVICAKMEEEGWAHEFWCANIETKQPCSLFYPICGYE